MTFIRKGQSCHMEGVSVRSSAGTHLTLFIGSPNWSEDNWLKDTFIIFPGCKVNQILKLGRTAGLTFQDCTNSSRSALLTTFSTPSFRSLSSPGPSLVLLPTTPSAFLNLPGQGLSPAPIRSESFLKHFVLLPTCFSPIPFSTMKHLYYSNFIRELTHIPTGPLLQEGQGRPS